MRTGELRERRRKTSAQKSRQRDSSEARDARRVMCVDGVADWPSDAIRVIQMDQSPCAYHVVHAMRARWHAGCGNDEYLL